MFPEVNKLQLLAPAKFMSVNLDTILIGLLNGDLNLINITSGNMYLNFTRNTIYPILFAKIKKDILNFCVISRWYLLS